MSVELKVSQESSGSLRGLIETKRQMDNSRIMEPETTATTVATVVSSMMWVVPGILLNDWEQLLLHL